MAPQVRDELTGTATADASGNVTVDRPSNIQNGDYLICVMAVGDDSPLTSASGWYALGRAESSTGNDRQIALLSRFITDAGSEPSSYTFTAAGNGDKAAWWIASISGLTKAEYPTDVDSSANNVSNDASPAALTITTVSPDAFIIAGWGTNYDESSDMSSMGGSWAVEANNIILDPIALNVASMIKTAIGATGDVEIIVDPVSTTAETSACQWALRAARFPSVNESVAISENVEVSITSGVLTVGKSEDVAVNEAVQVRINPLRTPLSFESLVVDEFTNQRVNPLRASVFDEVVITEASTQNIPLLLNVFDQVTTTDQSSAFLKQLFTSVYDQVTITDPSKSYPMRSNYITGSSSIGDSLSRKLLVTSDGVFHLFYSKGTPSNVYHSYSSNMGISWTEEAITSEPTYNQSAVRAATDSQSNIHIAWVGGVAEAYPPKNQVRYRKYTKGSGWGSIVEITAEDYYHLTLDIALDSNNNPHLVWVTAGILGLHYRKSLDGGSSWESAETPTTDEIASPCMAIDSNDYIHVAFADFEYGYSEICYMKNTGSWSGVTQLSTGSPDYQDAPAIAVGPDDTIHIVWYGYFEDNYYYQIRYIYNDGSWSGIQDLTNYQYNCEYPSISVDRDGAVYIVYHDDGGLYEDIVILRYISSWEEFKVINKTIDKWSATPMQAYYPQLSNGVSSNIALKGVAFVFTSGLSGPADLYFGCSSDFDLQFRGVPDPAESVSISDLISVETSLVDLLVNVYEAIVMSDDSDSLIKFLDILVNDSILLSEFVDKAIISYSLTVSTSEELVISEAVQSLIKCLRPYTLDTVSTSDTTYTLIKQLTPSVYDEISISEQIELLKSSLGILVSDNILVAEFVVAGSGINGFVLIAPPVRYGNLEDQIDNYDCYAQKFVCPGSGLMSISEIGLFCKKNNLSGYATLGIFTHDAVNNCPETLVADSNSGLLDVTGIDISKVSKDYDTEPALTGGETYWLVFQLNNGIPANVPSYDYKET